MSTEVHYRQHALPSGTTVYYREAGQYGDKPTLLLLHGFPTSSHMFRHLIPLLASSYHCIAPDLPGFGYTTTPTGYHYTFDQLTATINEWVEALQLKRYSLYCFDYGAPVAWRLAMQHPDRVQAIVSQNGNAYEKEGLSDAWQPIRKLWEHDTADNRAALHFLFQRVGLDFQYRTGVADLTRLSPDGSALDEYFMSRPGQPDIQTDLFYDYRTNVALYPQFHSYFRQSQVPLLAVWGDGDPFFLPAGAAAFQRDLPNALVKMIVGAGHFALETHVEEIAAEVTAFLGSQKLQ